MINVKGYRRNFGNIYRNFPGNGRKNQKFKKMQREKFAEIPFVKKRCD